MFGTFDWIIYATVVVLFIVAVVAARKSRYQLARAREELAPQPTERRVYLDGRRVSPPAVHDGLNAMGTDLDRA